MLYVVTGPTKKPQIDENAGDSSAVQDTEACATQDMHMSAKRKCVVALRVGLGCLRFEADLLLPFFDLLIQH